MIYLILRGRIGNQLFMYAAAKAIQLERGRKEKIVIDDTPNIPNNYLNSLKYYDLEDVEYVENVDKTMISRLRFKKLCLRVLDRIERTMTERQKWFFEKKCQKILQAFGIFVFENGGMKLPSIRNKDVLMRGFFQSEVFFEKYKNEIIDEFSLQGNTDMMSYPHLQDIKDRETVCISIKVQHNIGSEIYDVCSDGYWESAINYVIENVENPLFFICSDNVDYVREHLIDFEKYDVVVQDASYPVHVSLAVMAECKHFIIGNTSFGWWAQYLSKNRNKIVVAPSKWYGVDIPCDIYMENWHLIEV